MADGTASPAVQNVTASAGPMHVGYGATFGQSSLAWMPRIGGHVRYKDAGGAISPATIVGVTSTTVADLRLGEGLSPITGATKLTNNSKASTGPGWYRSGR